MNKKYFLFSLLLNQIIFAGLASGTLVKCLEGFVAIENLKVGDVVLSKQDEIIIENKIIAIKIDYSDTYQILTPQDVVCVSSSQKIYDQSKRKWITANQIDSRTIFIDLRGNEVPCLSCKCFERQQEVYELTLCKPHVFFISKDEFLLHNFAPMIGISLSWGGKIAIESIMLGLGVLGIKFFKDQQQNANIQLGTISNLSGNAGGSPEDPDKEKHPYGKYEDAPYHHQNSRGNKSRCPKNGQKALDDSLQIKNSSPHRISISDGQLVILKQTSPGVFHGYTCEWKELEITMQNVLKKAKWVNNNGKILK